jgi:23S rRNA (cytosine1962-C5)-methyltransferase
MDKIVLKRGKESSVLRRHPWVFSGACYGVDGDPEEGDVVQVLDSEHRSLGFGHYQENGSITVRILSFTDEPDQSFWNKRIQEAWNLRLDLELLNDENNCFRWIHGEGDGLPGLIVDYYNGNAVVQCHSSGMYKSMAAIKQALLVTSPDLKSIYHKSSDTLSPGSGIEANDEYIHGSAKVPVLVKECGNDFKINWESGQKTGFFIDQRENRILLAKYSNAKKVLNTFCYSGAFSVYALNAGAKHVVSLDASKKAIDLTNENIDLIDKKDIHESVVADAMEYLKSMANDFDVVVLDPPAFAKKRQSRHKAVQGYKRLNKMALKSIKPGGILFTFSCSQVVDKELFTRTIASAAIESGRRIRILHQLHQPADHPINIYHPESEYLKGLVLRVD